MKIEFVFDFGISARAKRTIRWLVLPGAVLLGSAAVAHAYDTSWIASDQPISASKLKGVLDEAQSRIGALEGKTSGVTVFARINSGCSVLNANGPGPTPWLSLQTGSAVGSGCTYAIAAGTFSVAPTCIVTADAVNSCPSLGNDAPTVSTLNIQHTACDTGAAYTGSSTNIICMGVAP